MAADPIWLQTLKKLLSGESSAGYSATQTPGSTPVYGYDIDIGQHGKINRDQLAKWDKREARAAEFAGEEWSGTHPGIESGYQGGLTREVQKSPGPHGIRTMRGKWGGEYGIPKINEPPTQTTNIVGWKNKPGGAGSSKWKKVIEQLGKMTGPEPDWSLSAQNVGVRSPWSPTNVEWSAVGADMFGRKKKKGPY